MKNEQLAQYKRDLMVLKLSLSIVGERSDASEELMSRRALLIEKIERLENELSGD
jgi:antitoxin component HigA of HigAB toxin-antitoxin module